MRKDGARIARRALLALLVVVSGAVAWSLRRPAPRATTPSAQEAPVPGQGTTVADGSLMRFREGDRKVEVKWRSMVGREGASMRLKGVEATFPFLRDGRASTATITADECLYQPQPQEASFRGNVHLRTDDGLELETERLDYKADEGVARTDDPVRFRRGQSSGTARGLDYRAEGGTLDLLAEVKLRLENEAGPATEIEAGAARATREERRVVFDGGTVVRQGARELRCERLQLFFNPETDAIERAVAIDDVDLRVGAGAPMPGLPAAEGGQKRLRCRKLQVFFRSKGILLEALAVNPASLEVLPGRGDVQERRLLESHRIQFAFDEAGRLTSLEAHGDGQTARRTVLTAVGLGSRPTPTRRVESNSLVSTLDPVSGAVREATFTGSVVFSEPGRKAWAGRAVFDEGSGRVALTDTPRIVDEAEGSELRGRRITLGTRGGGVAASESVRHTLAPRPRGSRSGMLGAEEPTVLLCREFDYDPGTRTARYRENALLRSGKDEVRAPIIVLEQPQAGGRRLTASGGTSSVLHPRAEAGATKEPAPVEARSREMVYEESANRIVYTGEVEIRQGDIVTRSPEAVVTLTKDGGAVDRLLAGDPVEVQQGVRRATGQRGTYTPANETLVLVGEKVVLLDVDRRLEGRILTFEVGSDRIRVDGREEVRTEAVFKKKEPTKP
jgi:LPS export ABC transporter protein LptC/lipopolysaccharide transport protein LptA